MRTPINRRQALSLTAAGLLPLAAHASWPQKPVSIVVPFAPGAGTDAMGRLLAQKLGEVLSASFVVENRAGASGAIGSQHVARSTPDGHTLLLIAAPFTTVAAVLPQAGYDPVRGFAPISMVAQGPLLWVCKKDLPVANLRELVDYARGRPGQLNYGSAGAGGINHLVLESLKARTGVSITHIPYRGIAPATVDLVAGQLDLITGTIPALAPFVRDGRVKPLAVTTSRRTPALPDVPSMAELGFSGFDVSNYFGLVAPRGTPQEVIDRINSALPRVLAMPDVQARFKTDALEPAALGATALGNFLTQDFGDWQKVVASQGIKVDSV
ncbi:MAG: tripartite tricarboxylate transporter substrate binding protein [Comamonadaceae bacterium]|nr:tripartite tricarboxylate transporter substrate binding protein [Comamonadaceae bacterium]